MSSIVHRTIPVQVWVDVDVEIAEMVKYLNTIPGVRTLSCCQGTIGEGGPDPYRAFVSVTWDSDQTLQRLKREFDVSPPTDDPEWNWDSHWCHVHPKEN